MEYIENLKARHESKVRGKGAVTAEAEASSKTVHFASLMVLCRLKHLELAEHVQEYKGKVTVIGDYAKNDIGGFAVFTKQGASASQVVAANVLDTASLRPGMTREASDAVSVCTQVKTSDSARLLKLPELDFDFRCEGFPDISWCRKRL